MSSFIDRLVNEEKELSYKIYNLALFLRGPDFKTLSEVHRNLLLRQHSLMVKYQEVLMTRIHILRLEGK